MLTELLTVDVCTACSQGITLCISEWSDEVEFIERHLCGRVGMSGIFIRRVSMYAYTIGDVNMYGCMLGARSSPSK